MTLGLATCQTCRNARWVCAVGDGPWHLSGHCDHIAIPCPNCNHGPEHDPWNSSCLACVSVEDFMTLNPDDPDAILAEMEAQFGEVSVPGDDVVDLSAMTDAELSGKFNDTRQALLERGEMFEATTEDGRTLHSIRAACLIEMAKRNMR